MPLTGLLLLLVTWRIFRLSLRKNFSYKVLEIDVNQQLGLVVRIRFHDVPFLNLLVGAERYQARTKTAKVLRIKSNT